MSRHERGLARRHLRYGARQPRRHVSIVLLLDRAVDEKAQAERRRALAQIGMALIPMRDGLGAISNLKVLDKHAQADPVLWASLGAGVLAFSSGLPIFRALLSGLGREAAIYARNELLFDLLTPVVLISFYCRYLAEQSWQAFIFPSSAMLLRLQFVMGLQFYAVIRDPNRIMLRQIARAVSSGKPQRLL